MNRDRVLVAMSREAAELFAGAYWHGDLVAVEDGLDPVVESLRAALDTDREQQVERVAAVVAREYDRQRRRGITVCSPSNNREVEQWEPLARAVLSVLEGADDE